MGSVACFLARCHDSRRLDKSLSSGAVGGCPLSRWLAQRSPNVKAIIFILDVLADQCYQEKLILSESDDRQLDTRVQEEKAGEWAAQVVAREAGALALKAARESSPDLSGLAHGSGPA